MRIRMRRITSKISGRTRRFRKYPPIVPLVILALGFFVLVFSGYHLLTSSGDLDHALAKSILHLGMPAMVGWEAGEPVSFDLRSAIYFLTNYDLEDPLSLMEATLPLSSNLGAQLRVWEERPFVFIQELSFAPEPVRPIPRPSPETDRPLPRVDSPRVLIYHTHTSEMYLGRAVPASQADQAHYQFRNLADPTVTGVMAVGRHLSQALNRLGIATLHEVRIHTLPTINHSYSNSERTVREILGKQQDFDMVIDLHRDAGVPDPTININGRQVARLVLVVGTAERIPLSHPNYRQNLEFAQKLKAVCDEMYPGLMRPIQVQKQARYNQHLHPRSLIVELGSVENTLEEALLAAELFANVLHRTL